MNNNNKTLIAASNLGREFCEQIVSETPQFHAEVFPYLPTQDLPEMDYRALRAEFGEVTAEMETEYRRAYNARRAEEGV